MEKEIRAALYEIFVGELGVLPEDFTDELTYKSIPEWDSQGHVILIVAIEEKFGIALESDDVVNLTSVQKVLDFLKSRGVHDRAAAS